jgi:hypothetical protein
VDANPFLSVADAQLASPVKAKHRAAERRAQMVPTPMERKLREQQKMAAEWRAWHREREAELLAGPHGKDIRGVLEFVKTMTPQSAGALVGMVERAVWLRGADKDTRLGVLTIIARGIAKLRERHDLAPFDDSLPGEPPTAFEQIRELLR